MKKIFLSLLACITLPSLYAQQETNSPNQDEESSIPLNQCGDLNHVALFTPLIFDRDSLTSEQKAYYVNTFIETATALFDFYTASTTSPTMEEPTKQLFKDLENALDCTNFEGWLRHISDKFESDKAKKLLARYHKIKDATFDFLIDAAIRDHARPNQCGNAKQVKKLYEQATILFEPNDLPAKKLLQLQAKNLMIVKSIIGFAIMNFGRPITKKNPRVKNLFRELEITLQCSAFDKWADHLYKKFRSRKAQNLVKRMKKLSADATALAGEALIVD